MNNPTLFAKLKTKPRKADEIRAVHIESGSCTFILLIIRATLQRGTVFRFQIYT